jgi:hypothetical protein
MGFATWYDKHVVPRVIKCACSSPAIMALREKVVPLAKGRVFEIGCGGGINQQFYDPARILQPRVSTMPAPRQRKRAGRPTSARALARQFRLRMAALTAWSAPSPSVR